MTTTDAVASLSAAERLAQAREETAALHAEQTRIEEDLATALLAGKPTQVVSDKRAKCANRLSELAILTRRLERQARIDERAQQLRDLKTAHEGRKELQQRIAAQEKILADAVKAHADAEDELHRLKYRVGDGVFSAELALRRHREQYPDTQESEIINDEG
jgi:hypothetical protein